MDMDMFGPFGHMKYYAYNYTTSISIYCIVLKLWRLENQRTALPGVRAPSRGIMG